MDLSSFSENREKSNRPAQKNQFRFMSDSQLSNLAYWVYQEMNRRISSKKNDIDMIRHLKELRKIVPEKLLSSDLFNDIHEPKALRQENLITPVGQRLKYLNLLLAQDWSYLWADRDVTKKYIVYAHVDPCGKLLSLSPKIGGIIHMPFYIGKGTRQRAFDLNRNQGHGIRIKQLLKSGFNAEKIVHIFSSGLSEAEAFELESKLIYFFGTIYEKDRNGCLLNLDLSLRPDFSFSMKKIDNIVKNERITNA